MWETNFIKFSIFFLSLSLFFFFLELYEIWIMKKAKHWRTDDFKLVLENSWKSFGLQVDQTSQS